MSSLTTVRLLRGPCVVQVRPTSTAYETTPCYNDRIRHHLSGTLNGTYFFNGNVNYRRNQ